MLARIAQRRKEGHNFTVMLRNQWEESATDIKGLGCYLAHFHYKRGDLNFTSVCFTKEASISNV